MRSTRPSNSVAKQIRIRHPNNTNSNADDKFDANFDNDNDIANPNVTYNYWHDLADQLCRVRNLRRSLPA